MNKEIKKSIHQFLDKHMFCVVSTISAEHKPEAAFVVFTYGNNLEIIFGTSKLSRKYKNIEQNPSIALVVADTTGEVQYEGIVKVLSSAEYEQLVEGNFFKKLPGAEKYRADPNQIFLKISPTWLRFIQLGQVDQVSEFTEFM